MSNGRKRDTNDRDVVTLMLYLLISRNWNILIDTKMCEHGLLDAQTIAKNKEEYVISHTFFLFIMG